MWTNVDLSPMTSCGCPLRANFTGNGPYISYKKLLQNYKITKLPPYLLRNNELNGQMKCPYLWWDCRDHSGHGLGQWEEALLCNACSHWPSPYPEWSLGYSCVRQLDASGCGPEMGVLNLQNSMKCQSKFWIMCPDEKVWFRIIDVIWKIRRYICLHVVSFVFARIVRCTSPWGVLWGAPHHGNNMRYQTDDEQLPEPMLTKIHDSIWCHYAMR